ncbi:MAG: glycoside hydrolase family 88 protein [Bacteroidia bacterium]|nr:glycoside hydrolase family 88 protein [Bacteroidia bacterium]
MSFRKQVYPFAVVLLLVFSCQSGSKLENVPVNQIKNQLKLLARNYNDTKALMNIQGQEVVTIRSLNSDGSLKLIPSKDWCSGFYAGSLWLAARLSGDAALEKLAREFTIPLEQEKYNGDTHDMGFKMMCSFGQGYRLTNDTAYRDILIQSAKTLTTRFNEKVGAFRSWDHNKDKWHFPVIIDNMMNLELLFWASKQTGDQLYYNIAVKHAETTLANHFRADNSSYHVVDYDTLTGAVIQKNTHQGYSDSSAWARGQAWGLYGYTMCYRESGIISFLYQAEKIADFILHHPNLPSDKIPYWDFDAPATPSRPRDVSAAAITASALYELAQFIPKKKDFYIQSAEHILKSLKSDYLSKPGENKGFLLGHSTGSFPQNSEIDVPINYADYYYLEALERQINFKKLK